MHKIEKTISKFTIRNINGIYSLNGYFLGTNNILNYINY